MIVIWIPFLRIWSIPAWRIPVKTMNSGICCSPVKRLNYMFVWRWWNHIQRNNLVGCVLKSQELYNRLENWWYQHYWLTDGIIDWNLNKYLVGRLMCRISNGKTNMPQLVYERYEEIHSNDTRQKYFRIVIRVKLSILCTLHGSM